MALGTSLKRYLKGRRVAQKRKETEASRVELAWDFSAEKMKTTLDAVDLNSVPATHCLAFWYGSLAAAKAALLSGVPATSGFGGGVVFTLHRPHDITIEDASVFSSHDREAVLVCSVPRALLEPLPGNLASSPNIKILPAKVLSALRPSTFTEGVSDPKPWFHEVLFLPPSNIRRAFQLLGRVGEGGSGTSSAAKDVSTRTMRLDSMTPRGDRSRSMNYSSFTEMVRERAGSNFGSRSDAPTKKASVVSTTRPRGGSGGPQMKVSSRARPLAIGTGSDAIMGVDGAGGDDGGVSETNAVNLWDKHNILKDYQIPAPQSPVKMGLPADHLFRSANPATYHEFTSRMTEIRRQCSASGTLPLFHFTQPYLGPLIVQAGFRMSTQGQGDGGVYFSVKGPASYGKACGSQ